MREKMLAIADRLEKRALTFRNDTDWTTYTALQVVAEEIRAELSPEKEMGFDHMTVKMVPGASTSVFTAEPVEAGNGD